MKVFHAIFLLLLLLVAQSVSADEEENEIIEIEHSIRLHIFSENELYVFEAISYATMSNRSFEGNLKAWIPREAMNISIDSDLNPLDFEMQGNFAIFKLFIPPLNITNIYIKYEMKVEPEGFFEKQIKYEIENLYPIDYFSIIIISQPSFNIASSDNLEILMPTKFSEQYNAYITGIVNKDALAGQQKISIKFTKSQNILPYIAIIAALAIALITILKRKGKANTQAQCEALAATLKEIEKDYKTGELTEEEYKKLKSEYEKRLARAKR